MSKKWYSYFVVTDESKAADAPARAVPEPAPVRAGDLAPEAPATVPPLVDATTTADLSIVYDAAKISEPPHGYTVLKIAEMLASEHIRELPADVRRKSVMVALDAAGVKIDEIVQDAVRRDRALDTYERVLQQNVDELSAAVAAENRQLEDEITRRIAELRARIDDNVKRLATDQAELQAWRVRKHQEEALIAETVAHFVTENPITRGAVPKGDADAR